MGIGLKLFLAGLSGCLVALVFLTLNGTENAAAQGLMYGVSGALFMAGVLLPYLKKQDLFSWRSAALVLVSGVSFYCAVFAAVEWSSGRWGPNLQDYVMASVIGAAIVLLAAPLLLALRFSVKYAGLSILAAVGGGISFGILSDLFAYSMFLSFASWHMFMCISLHVADPTAAKDGWLAGVPRPRLRIAIGLFSLIVILPPLDDGIGSLLQKTYAARDGGIQVHEQVTANGFRDKRRKPFFNTGCNFGCVDLVKDGTYAFQEYVVADDRGRYQVIYISDRSDPNCWVFGKKNDAPLNPTYKAAGRHKEGRCTTYRLVNEPVANYVVSDSIETVDILFGLFSLQKNVRRVVRIDDEKIIAEANDYLHHSRVFGGSSGVVEPWEEFIRQALPAGGDEWEPPE